MISQILAQIMEKLPREVYHKLNLMPVKLGVEVIKLPPNTIFQEIPFASFCFLMDSENIEFLMVEEDGNEKILTFPYSMLRKMVSHPETYSLHLIFEDSSSIGLRFWSPIEEARFLMSLMKRRYKLEF